MQKFVLCAFAALSSVFAQDYFPLQTGNQWLFRGSRFGQTLTIEVGESAKFDGVDYFAVTGFSPDRRWLRRADDGSILEYDENAKAVKPYLSPQYPEGQRFVADVGPCNQAAVVQSRNSKIFIPAGGGFDNALEIRYVDSQCADAGIETDFFLPDVGPAKRVETSFAGPVTYDLVYARVNGAAVLTQDEVSFSVSTPSPIFDSSPVFVRMTIRKGGPQPLRLDFSSGQIFNVELTDSDGVTVYNWMIGRLFIAQTQNIYVNGEKNWLLEFTPPGGLKPGFYTLDAYLTTADTPDRPYRAKVLVQVVTKKFQ